MNILVLDSESDGLAYECTKLHVLSYTRDGETYHSTGDYDDMRAVINSSDLLVAHNSVRHDMVVFNRILGIPMDYRKWVDTLALSWYLYPERNKHGLANWGGDLGVAKPKVDDWQNLSFEEYAHRCEEDTKINLRLWEKMFSRLKEIYGNEQEQIFRFIRYLSFKMDCLRQQEENPLTLDVDLCEKYLKELEQKKEEKVEALKKAMPKNPITKKKEKPKVIYKKDGSLSSHGVKWFETLRELKLPEDTAGPVTYVDGYEDGNPNSTDQVKQWLFGLGWKPRTWKYVRDKVTGDERRIEQVRKDGHLCESVKELVSKDPAIELLDGLSVITHRIGVLRGFLNARNGNKVVSSAGGFTNTLRLQHRAPVVNLPGVEADYGEWCRGVLVSPDDNHVLCGADVSSLEDMTKRHYIKPLDPQFVEDMSVDGYDAHLDLALHAGAVTQEDIDKHNAGEINLKPLRSKFKAANYSCVYGVGAPKLARETGMKEKEAKILIDAYWDRNWAVKKVAKQQYVKTLKDGSMWLKNGVSGFYHNLRYDKDRWSTTNQSTGVYVFDMWVMFCRRMGLTISMQYHDEILFAVKKGDEERVSEILHEAMAKVNETLKLNVTIEVEEQYGDSYASVH